MYDGISDGIMQPARGCWRLDAVHSGWQMDQLQSHAETAHSNLAETCAH